MPGQAKSLQSFYGTKNNNPGKTWDESYINRRQMPSSRPGFGGGRPGDHEFNCNLRKAESLYLNELEKVRRGEMKSVDIVPYDRMKYMAKLEGEGKDKMPTTTNDTKKKTATKKPAKKKVTAKRKPPAPPTSFLDEPTPDEADSAPKKRGRPPKPKEPSLDESTPDEADSAPKKRGRPPKPQANKKVKQR